MPKLHISLPAENIFHIGSVGITNSLFTSWVVTLLIVVGAYLISKNLQNYKKTPSRWQSILEMVFEYIHDLAVNVAGDKADIFFPLVMTFFIFILFSNWIGLLPGVGSIGIREGANIIPYLRAPTADLNTTLALSLISVISIQFFGVKTLGMSYFKKFVNLKNPIYTFVGVLELVSEISKIISFAFRLFGNIFAGEVLLTVMAFLVPIIIPAPFYGLELFVGIIQAFVFSVLTLVFLNMATIGAEH